MIWRGWLCPPPGSNVEPPVATVSNVYVCLSVVCLSVSTHISRITNQNFTKFSVHVACGRGSVPVVCAEGRGLGLCGGNSNPPHCTYWEIFRVTNCSLDSFKTMSFLTTITFHRIHLQSINDADWRKDTPKFKRHCHAPSNMTHALGY